MSTATIEAAKVCGECRQMKMAEQFYLAGKYRDNVCKACRIRRNAENRGKKREAKTQARPIIESEERVVVQAVSEQTRVCVVCNQAKKPEEFYMGGDGKYRDSTCKACRSKRSNNLHKEKRDAMSPQAYGRGWQIS